MIIKLVVFILLLMILGSLGSGLFFLINDHGQNHRMVKALTLDVYKRQ